MSTPQKARDDLAHARSSLKMQQIINVVMGLVVIVMIFKLSAAYTGERIVQQTPDGDKSRWISETSGPSEAKLLDAAYWVAHLTQDIAPNSVVLNAQMLKPWIDPENWDQLSKRAESEARKLAEMRATQTFTPTSYVVDLKRTKVALVGEVRKTIGNVVLPVEVKSYVFQFKQKGLLLYLADWRETKKDDPVEFDQLKAASNGASK